MSFLRARHLVLALATTFAVVAIAAPAANAATPIDSSGQIHACYKAKGKKGKGAVRLVAPGKACKAKNGEKPIMWSAGGATSSGVSADQMLALLGLIQKQQSQIDALTGRVGGLDDLIDGLTGQIGGLQDLIDGLTGDIGGLQDLLDGLTGDIGDLDALLATLTGRVGALEGILAGITNGDLLGLLDTLPVVDDLCSQLSLVTGQANSLLTVIDGLGLNGVLTALGGLLQVPPLPNALDPFSC